MKRSRQIGLTLLASLSLAACGDSEEPTQVATYLTRQACVEDWGSDDDCDDDGDGRWRGPRYYYLGGRPYYYAKKSCAAMAVPGSAQFSRLSMGSTSPRATSTTAASVSRSGFGGRASFHGASS